LIIIEKSQVNVYLRYVHNNCVSIGFKSFGYKCNSSGLHKINWTTEETSFSLQMWNIFFIYSHKYKKKDKTMQNRLENQYYLYLDISLIIYYTPTNFNQTDQIKELHWYKSESSNNNNVISAQIQLHFHYQVSRWLKKKFQCNPFLSLSRWLS
jgi:hypothetical protein